MKSHNYTIGIKHHSIAQHYSITYNGTLTNAKRAATKEFGGGFNDHNIVILDTATGECVAIRRIDCPRWRQA